MSDTDSFIDEVTEEVRRDKLFGYLRRYGWIGIVLVVLIVGGAAYSEWRKAQAATAAADLGDAILAAYQENDSLIRADKLSEIQASNPRARAVLDLIAAAALSEADDNGEAAARLDQIAANSEVPEVYRNLAGFKAALARSGAVAAGERAQHFEPFATPGNPMRLLAEEQIGLTEIELGASEDALNRFQAILSDAEVTSGLQQRAMQAIVSLGGEPDLSALQPNEN